MPVRVSGLQRARGRKKEARGNTGRTILGKGLFWARGRTRGQAGQGNKCNKGRGKASSPRRRRFLSDCLPASLAEPAPGLSPAPLDSFLRGRCPDRCVCAARHSERGWGCSQVGTGHRPCESSSPRRFSAHRSIPLGIPPSPRDSGLAFPGGTELLQSPNLNRAVRTGMLRP